MKILLIILFLLVNSQNLFANPQICGWIMDEPFKEYQEEAKDQHAAFYVVVSDGECEYGMTIGENSEEKANEYAKNMIMQLRRADLDKETKFYAVGAGSYDNRYSNHCFISKGSPPKNR